MCNKCNTTTAAPVLPYASPIERMIARQLVADILRAGHVIAVYDGEEYACGRSVRESDILRAMGATELDELRIWKRDGAPVGAVLLIWGNGRDLISDNSANPETEALLAGALAIANEESL